MCAGSLLAPAKRDLNLAVVAVAAVTYDEIIADTLPVIAFSVPLVKYGRISVACARMVYDYGSPLPLQFGGRQPIARNVSTDAGYIWFRLYSLGPRLNGPWPRNGGA
jgi:hypothetical protein